MKCNFLKIDAIAFDHLQITCGNMTSLVIIQLHLLVLSHRTSILFVLSNDKLLFQMAFRYIFLNNLESC